jgi:hypothetical protein
MNPLLDEHLELLLSPFVAVSLYNCTGSTTEVV